MDTNLSFKGIILKTLINFNCLVFDATETFNATLFIGIKRLSIILYVTNWRDGSIEAVIIILFLIHGS